MSKAHQAAEALRADGYAVVIVGEADHPEVEGILAHAGGEAIVVESAADLPERLPVAPHRRRRADHADARRASPRSSTRCSRASRELRVRNTICSATGQRQRSAEELARSVDVMVVVGGHNSGNTTRLVEICRAVNPRVHHVETADELERAWFAGAETVGVTAGASTPDEQIGGVIDAIEAMG